jgi:RNA polymerase sigma-70 factor (ECF subfamily)
VTDPNVDRGKGSDSISLSLLERVRADDQAAWVRLVALYDPVLDGWCSSAGLQAADAADVKQEVFTAVTRSIGDFRRNRGSDSFRGWLFAITRNKIRDRLRKLSEDGVGGTAAHIRLSLIAADDLDAEPPFDSHDSNDERLLFLQALEIIRCEFESKTWDAFWQVTVEGRSPADVAAELGISTNAVYLARSRILRRLRTEFSELIHTEDG